MTDTNRLIGLSKLFFVFVSFNTNFAKRYLESAKTDKGISAVNAIAVLCFCSFLYLKTEVISVEDCNTNTQG